MNVDNFISARPSVRVHAQPGGNSSMSSLIYGGDAPPAQRSQSNASAGGGNKANAAAGAADTAGGDLRNFQGEVHRTTTFVISPEARTELLSMCKRLRLKTKKERSCKHFMLFEDATAPNTLIVQEAYDNYNALCLHERQEHAVDFAESVVNMGGSVQVHANTMKLLG